MPLYPPRSEPVRKKEILAKREDELRHATTHQFSELVRFAQLKAFKGIVEQFRYEEAPKKGPPRGARALREQEAVAEPNN